MTLTRRALLTLAATAALAGCGSDEEGEPIPQGVASAIESQLNAIESRVDAGSAGACLDIEKSDDSGTFSEVERQVASIPDGVDREVVDALQESIDRLKDLVRDECNRVREETETTPEQTETVTVPEEETVPEETVPEVTTPEETTPEETVPDDEFPPGNPEAPGGGTGGSRGGVGGGVPAPEEDG